MIITEVQTTQATTTHLILRQNVVRVLLTNMRGAVQSLPEEHQATVLQAINEWEVIFFRDYKMDSKVDDDRLAAAHALLFLRFSHIENNIIVLAQSISEKIKWVQFSNEIKGLVNKILPQNTDLEVFIESDKVKQLELRSRIKTAQVIREVMPAILDTFKRLEDELYENADRVNQDLRRRSEAIRQVLENLNNVRGTTIEELHGVFDRLTEKVAQISHDLKQGLHATQDFGNRIKIQEGALSQLLDECESVIKKV